MKSSPATGRPRAIAVVDHDVCLMCAACVAVCPPDAIFLHPGALLVSVATCTGCERCVRMCPVSALAMQNVAEAAGVKVG